MITFLKRMYLIFILLPIAIIYACLTMLFVVIEHIYNISVIKFK